MAAPPPIIQSIESALTVAAGLAAGFIVGGGVYAAIRDAVYGFQVDSGGWLRVVVPAIAVVLGVARFQWKSGERSRAWDSPDAEVEFADAADRERLRANRAMVSRFVYSALVGLVLGSQLFRTIG
jgi:hypothetical protein